MAERVEGTILLDGLIEAALAASAQVEDGLRGWVEKAEAAGLGFSLRIESGSCSLLASDRPIEAAALGADPAARIREMLEELPRLFPSESRRSLFSPLRTIEYRKGEEVQTLYFIAPDGAIRVGQRTVEARTVAPPQPVTARQRLRMAALGVLIAVAILGVSAFFVDYRGLVRDALDRFSPLNPDAMKVEMSPFAEYFTVEKKAASGGARALLLTLKRTKAFPLTDADCERLLTSDPNRPLAADPNRPLAPDPNRPLASRLAIEALAAGYVRCELYDRKGDFLGFSMQRIAPLREKETFELAIPLPSDRHPARIVITY
jgi:hypothetical protein